MRRMRDKVHTLCCTGNLLAHHLALPALCFIVPGLVMLDCGPFVVTGEDGR